MGGSLGLLIGRTACRVTTAAALGHVAGYLICNDVSIPYSSHYRPAIRERCRDGFCPMSPPIPAKAVATQPDQLAMTIAVNGLVRSRSDGSDLVRGAARLVAEISEFITLDPGDLVLLGEPADAPLASPGDRVRIEIPELGFLENEVVAA
jgi:5-oxopent-3-ene-1,2,5-tricarboxylate decarboxylase/2-hydroxyhepta-2,4-diene-1,7-dioate isomerase